MSRLLIKVGCGGVDISSLHESMRYALWCCGQVWEDDEDVIITSTWEGPHMPGSFHFWKKAIDVQYPPSWNHDSKEVELINLLGKKYDVVYKVDHIHMEYQPKSIPKELA